MVRTVHGGLLNLRRIIFFADHVPPEPIGMKSPAAATIWSAVQVLVIIWCGDRVIVHGVYRRLRERQSLTAESEIFCCLSGYGDVRVGRRRAPVYVEQAT